MIHVDDDNDENVVDDQSLRRSLGRVNNSGSEVHAIRFLKSSTTPIHQYYFSQNMLQSIRKSTTSPIHNLKCQYNFSDKTRHQVFQLFRT